MKQLSFMVFHLSSNDMILVLIYMYVITYGNKLPFKKESMDSKFIEGKDLEIKAYILERFHKIAMIAKGFFTGGFVFGLITIVAAPVNM